MLLYNIDFLRNGPIILLQNAWNQSNVQKCNEIKLLSQWITTVNPKIACHLFLHLKAKYFVNYKNIDFLKNGPIILLQNAWKQCKVQKYIESKLLYYWITAIFAEIECHLNLH